MARRGCSCGVCEAANQPAVCVSCVNLRLAEKYKIVRRLTHERDALRNRMDAELRAKREADAQRHLSIERLELKTKLQSSSHKNEKLLVQSKLKAEKRKSEYEARRKYLDTVSSQLNRIQQELFEVFYPDLMRAHIAKLTSLLTEVNLARRHVFRHLTKVFPLHYLQGDSDKPRGSKERQLLRVCGACLPVRDDPHSVSTEDLSASLGYMVQLVYQTGRYLMTPMLHNAAFAASSSRIWERTSYWDASPVSRSEEYPLFLPRKGERVKLSSDGKADKSGKSDSHASSSGSSFLSLEKPRFLKLGSSESTQSDSDRDVRQAVKLLKRSVSCICVYGYAMLGVPMPSTLPTFETFMELLALLSSKESKTRPSNTRPALMNSNTRADGSLLQSYVSSHELKLQALRNQSRMEMSDFFCIGGEARKFSDSGGDEWDVVETPLLPPPSQAEDIEQWTRAMITDATK
ncbi:uncharacterized protein LOC112350552 isoform X1 [Selaginella moellendorffii]|uniref:uncharacterized protein LOC112350552 isoform X1 n=1 Tax=Selaginella moellendorffii TaxID=88036 RepID=UPI000D1CEE4F|nr:uncharacterized protein LOC112350552 isoform X1 [Selaginella moellendorffii]|eukprot:XP_024542663.1 uncharacterized protein LOC112350552 isoform X1 [Selaginella moellendorffii]